MWLWGLPGWLVGRLVGWLVACRLELFARVGGGGGAGVVVVGVAIVDGVAIVVVVVIVVGGDVVVDVVNAVGGDVGVVVVVGGLLLLQFVYCWWNVVGWLVCWLSVGQ